MSIETALKPQTLRGYQVEAVNAVLTAWEGGESAPLAALATGAGKTTIIAQVLVESIDPRRQRALVLGHTQEIIGQLHDRINQQFGGQLQQTFNTAHALFAPGLGIVMADRNEADARIVVATRQSLHARRIEQVLKYGAFDVVVVDEAHHALGENSYGDIIEVARAANPDLRILGVTATPKRTDEAALGSVFDKIVYQWLIPDGINGGYLVPVTRVKIKTSVDLSKVRSSQGDYAQNQLASALDMANWADLSVQAYQQYIAPTGRSTLAFMPSVEMSKRFASALRHAGVAAEHIDGETSKEQRIDILRRYSAGHVQVVSNYGVLTEGFDAPRTAAIFMGRPTRSKTLFTQIVGRGLRPFAGKKDCLLVDMTVVDTKALNTGDLLGKMRTCKACQADFYAGMRACPKCGAPVERTKREILEEGLQIIVATDDADSPFAQRGLTLVASYEQLFEQSFGAWYWDANGYMSLGLGFEGGTLVIVPPLLSDSFTLVRASGTKDKPVVETVKELDDLQDLIAFADGYIRQNGFERLADKDAYWRNAPASPAQIGLLTTLGETVAKDISKGEASQLISHRLSVKRVLEALT